VADPHGREDVQLARMGMQHGNPCCHSADGLALTCTHIVISQSEVYLNHF